MRRARRVATALMAVWALAPGLQGCAPRARSRAGAPSEGRVEVERLTRGDVRFSQLDRAGRATSITHFLRELPPRGGQGFTIDVTGKSRGTIAVYCLRNVATGEVYEFRNLPARRAADAGWVIADEGWEQIRDQLEAKMRVELSLPLR